MTLPTPRLLRYTAASLTTVSMHTLLRLTIPSMLFHILLVFASVSAYTVFCTRQSLTLTDTKSYYAPLCVLLLLLGELSEQLVFWVSDIPFHEISWHRSAVHASLAWSVIAEAEWWRSGFDEKLEYEKCALPDDKTIGLLFPKHLKSIRQALAFIGTVWASMIIWTAITWTLLALLTVVLFQDHRRSVLDTFILATWRTDGGRPLWWGMQVLLWFPVMNAAKKCVEEIEKRVLLGDAEGIGKAKTDEDVEEDEMFILPEREDIGALRVAVTAV